MEALLDKEGRLLIGLKQTFKALKEDQVDVLYIAEDADQYVIKEIQTIAQEKGVKIIYVDSMKKLGKQCGISVGAATASIIKND